MFTWAPPTGRPGPRQERTARPRTPLGRTRCGDLRSVRSVTDGASGRWYCRRVMAATWAAIGLLAATLGGSLFYLGSKIDALGGTLGARIDAQGADLGARIDALGGRMDVLDARLT